jgi:uncharacterized protein YggT (Ycf19 family)
MARRVIEDGNRRVILDRNEVIIEQNGETLAVKNPDAAQVERRDVAVDDAAAYAPTETVDTRRRIRTNRGAAALSVVMRLLAVAGIAVAGLLIARVALLALEADESNQAVSTLYDITGPIIAPFKGLISVQQLDGGGILEPASIIAAALVLAGVIVVVGISGMASSRTYGRA